MFTNPIPFKEAIAALDQRVLLPTTGNSAQLAALPAALRDEAMFSSKVSDARILQAAKDRIAAIVQPEGRAPGQSMNTATAREQIRDLLKSLGYAPEQGKEGSIEDLTSRSRLDLIIDTNVAMARGRGQWTATQDADVLDEWPCQELYRAEDREHERNWAQRWRAAGGKLYGVSSEPDFNFRRAIARKNDPIWYRISRFGKPWPPFDFNSGMDVEDVDREEAIALGVISERESVDPKHAPALNLSAPLAHLADFLVHEVTQALGSRSSIKDGLLSFIGAS